MASKTRRQRLALKEGTNVNAACSLYNWFGDCAAKAGMEPGISPHGLRKPTARRLAEAGCAPHQIAAITGHQSLKGAERYTRAVRPTASGRCCLRSASQPREGLNPEHDWLPQLVW